MTEEQIEEQLQFEFLLEEFRRIGIKSAEILPKAIEISTAMHVSVNDALNYLMTNIINNE